MIHRPYVHWKSRESNSSTPDRYNGKLAISAAILLPYIPNNIFSVCWK